MTGRKEREPHASVQMPTILEINELVAGAVSTLGIGKVEIVINQKEGEEDRIFAKVENSSAQKERPFSPVILFLKMLPATVSLADDLARDGMTPQQIRVGLDRTLKFSVDAMRGLLEHEVFQKAIQRPRGTRGW